MEPLAQLFATPEQCPEHFSPTPNSDFKLFAKTELCTMNMVGPTLHPWACPESVLYSHDDDTGVNPQVIKAVNI
jgi:hypothetical protein